MLNFFTALFKKTDLWLFAVALLLLFFSFLILNSISPDIFPSYYFYGLISLVFFLIFASFDFSIITFVSPFFYIFSLLFLALPLVFGQVTRGTIRWLEFGSFSFQPAEVARPFLILFWSYFLSLKKIGMKRFLSCLFLFVIPAFLILIQPSLGVFIITSVSFLGVLLASSFDKKKLLWGAIILSFLLPISYTMLAPYQKQRIMTFINPQNDPYGAGYNSIQSTIAVGSGGLLGRGLGQGIQTQLQFLPERKTDFVFASIAEELGLAGVLILILFYSILFLRIIYIMSLVKFEVGKLYLSGVFFGLLFQVFVHIGMNLGIMPVTGVPLPIVSAGGSSLLATMISLGIASSVLALSKNKNGSR